jgi:hypothetical protein
MGLMMNPTGNRKRKTKVVQVIALEDLPSPTPELIVDNNAMMVTPITKPDEMIVELSSPSGMDVGSC